VGWSNSPTFGFNLGHMSRITDRILIDSKFFIPYSKRTDAIFDETLQRSTIELAGNISYKFAQRTKTRKNRIYIASKTSSKANYDYDKYGLEFQMPYVTNFYLTGGLNFLRAACNNDRLDIIDSIKYVDIRIGNTSSVSVNIGITRDRYTYHVFSSPQLGGKPRYRYYRVRNYALLSYAPYVSYSVIGEEDNNNRDHSKINTGYVEPSKIKRLGWRFGAEVKMGSALFHNMMYFGLEMGRVHALVIDEFIHGASNNSYYSTKAEYTNGSVYFIMKMGFEFGTKNHK
jgi:hypothetical protein